VFRERVLVPEPFVLVALIAPVRRILVITAEFGTLSDQGESAAFRYAMNRARAAHRDDRRARDVSMTGTGAARSCSCATGTTIRWRP
jgi:hypothetical protein